MSEDPVNSIDSESMKEFVAFLRTSTGDGSRLAKALNMLKGEHFQLFSDVLDSSLVGVIKSQNDPSLIYACHLNQHGEFSCCTQNLFPCGGLRGKLCKHLMVLIIGLAQNNAIDIEAVKVWVTNTQGTKPVLNKESMSEVFLRYKGMEAGEVDWRPTETVPEDFYIY